MTATINESGRSATGGAVGRISRVPGPVIDAEFPADAMPEIYNALTVDVELDGKKSTITFETAQHLGENLVRAIATQSTDGLVRGQEVRDTGSAMTVPVGDVVKGHIFIAIGDSLGVERSELDVPDGL